MTASNLTVSSVALKIPVTHSNCVKCGFASLSKVFRPSGKYPYVNNATEGMVLFVANLVLNCLYRLILVLVEG